MGIKKLLFPFFLLAHSFCSGAMLFNGTNAVVDTADITLSGTFTLSLWYNLTALSGQNQIFIGDDINGLGVRFGINGANKFIIRVFLAGDVDQTIAIPNAQTGAWHYFVVTRDASNKVDLYVDGGSANRLYTDAAETGNCVFSVMGRAAVVSGQYYGGLLDDVRIYNRVLSTPEISSLYLSKSRLIITDGLTAWWKLDQGTNGVTAVGTSVQDSGLTGFTGTPAGTINWTASNWINYP